ncbi:MAG: GNAT family N-acetyltransferase [Actinomycetota bacterium]|nr:GNAT family N-acetyltransferase [Actinomycetota bacterium]
MPESYGTRDLRPQDRARWEVLHRGYCDHYGIATTDAERERLWGWLLAHEHGLWALVVEHEGRVVGIAHVRPVVRPLHVRVDGWLDDLYVDPEARGSGAAAALLNAVRRLGADRGWSGVRWITGESNARARAFYEREGAAALSVVTYDVGVLPAPPGPAATA